MDNKNYLCILWNNIQIFLKKENHDIFKQKDESRKGYIE